MDKRYKLSKLNPELHNAYSTCYNIAKSHYENFPVASIILPSHLRRSIVAIYAFARIADDIADEGDHSQDARLEAMTKFEAHLYDIQYGKPPTDPIFIALKHTIECFNLPIQLFYDLLTAFRQDILKNRYQNFAEVKDYCHYSANPIGRLLLHLAGQATPQNLQLSDSICTGLQIINFLQDVELDLVQKNRCYIPMEELIAFEVSFEDIATRKQSPQYMALLQKQIARTKEIYLHGMRLGNNLPGFFGLEIRFIIACGYKILERLEARNNVWQRPVISKVDMLFILSKILCFSLHYKPEPILEQSWTRR